jgi:hypothetical protein
VKTPLEEAREELVRVKKRLQFAEDSNQRLLQANKDLHRAVLEAERVAREEFEKRFKLEHGDKS